MKKLLKILIIIIILCPQTKAKAWVTTDFSYTNIGNDYTFYLDVFFSIGSSGLCPPLVLVQYQKSNDTVYVKAIYDMRGTWPLMGCGRLDSVKYTNTFSDVKYFNVSTNTLKKVADTSWSEVDSTFDIHPTLINQSSAQIKHFTIYPNPSRNLLYIKSITGIAWSELKIYNTLGQMLLAEKENKTTINISQLPVGMYCLQLFDNERNNIGIIQFFKE